MAWALGSGRPPKAPQSPAEAFPGFPGPPGGLRDLRQTKTKNLETQQNLFLPGLWPRKTTCIDFRSLGGLPPRRPTRVGGREPPRERKQYDMPAKGQLRIEQWRACSLRPGTCKGIVWGGARLKILAKTLTLVLPPLSSAESSITYPYAPGAGRSGNRLFGGSTRPPPTAKPTGKGGGLRPPPSPVGSAVRGAV